MGMRFVGAHVERREDQRLLTGAGTFTDDVRLVGALTAFFLRSPHAHAKIRSIDVDEASSSPGVHAIWTHQSLPAVLKDQPVMMSAPTLGLKQVRPFPLLAGDEVKYVGEPIALIVAESRALAEDAADLIMVDYEPLPAAVDCRDALAGLPLAHAGAPDNIAGNVPFGFGDIEAAFANAAVHVRETFWVHRGVCHAMECRAVAAQFDGASGHLTVWSATQTPHLHKRMLVEMLGFAEDKVRVIAPDVGGGFGTKGILYGEEVLLPAASHALGRPVRWTEDRLEHVVASTHERDQSWTVEMATDAEGRLLGVRGEMIHDTGAYVPHGLVVPTISATTLPGPYVLPAYHMRAQTVFTNKPPVAPIRGAGRPQAVFVMERLLDKVAARLNLDRAEVRLRNLISPAQMPYRVGLTFRDGSPLVYDSGDYPSCQRTAMEQADYASFPQRQKQALQQGRYIGLGIANYVEGTGLGPFESARVRVLADGTISVLTGASPQGQGHQTMLAQVAAEAFGAELSDVEVKVGDTANNELGWGAYASRTAATAGPSVHLAAGELRNRVLTLAGHMLGEPAEALTIKNRMVVTSRSSNKSIPLSDVYRASRGSAGMSFPKGLEPGLSVDSHFTPRQAVYANGTHIVEVEVDPQIGEVTFLRYCVAHDCGTVLNPMIVDGQIQGGVAHGIGNALLEKMRYDENGQPLTVTLADYLLPMAPNVPDVEIRHLESPTSVNPLGAKGAGEGGTIPASAAIISAIENALAPFGVRINESPVLPDRLCEMIDEAQESREIRPEGQVHSLGVEDTSANTEAR